jgi:hypothetical protein
VCEFPTRHLKKSKAKQMEGTNKLTPPAAKWIQETEDSDSEQVGLVPHNRGYKHILFNINNNNIIIMFTNCCFNTNILNLLQY